MTMSVSRCHAGLRPGVLGTGAITVWTLFARSERCVCTVSPLSRLTLVKGSVPRHSLTHWSVQFGDLRMSDQFFIDDVLL